MKRLVIIVAALVIALIIALVARPGHTPTPGTEQALNLAPRPLSNAQQAAFLPLVCAKATGPSGLYAHQCASLPGYPAADYGGAGLGLGISLQNVILGHLTSAEADEAYVTYAGSFEPHANNYGGGILLTKEAGKWTLKAWYPGGQASTCVLLTPTGRAHFVCMNGWEGQGEVDTSLTLTTLPPPSGDRPALLRAKDLRDTMNPNANCQGVLPGQTILLSIKALAPAADGAKATIAYISAATAHNACATSQLANAKPTIGTLDLHWHDGHIDITPKLDFAPAS